MIPLILVAIFLYLFLPRELQTLVVIAGVAAYYIWILFDRKKQRN
ncbi:hypothetical protein B481_0173 [Planococcus halocryophilus Or1]|nr:hypothetical protein B481_0173 [Planococcus halocryophilus Or1]